MWKIGNKVSVWGADSGIVDDCEIYNISPEVGLVQTRHIPTGAIGLFAIEDLICSHYLLDSWGEDCDLIGEDFSKCEDCPNRGQVGSRSSVLVE